MDIEEKEITRSTNSLEYALGVIDPILRHANTYGNAAFLIIALVGVLILFVADNATLALFKFGNLFPFFDDRPNLNNINLIALLIIVSIFLYPGKSYRIALVSILEPLIKSLIRLTGIFSRQTIKSYQFDEWVAESTKIGKEYEIPFEITNLQEVKFRVRVEKAKSNHWRAGVKFLLESHLIIFHLYEDESAPELLQARFVIQARPSERIYLDKRYSFKRASEIKSSLLQFFFENESFLMQLNQENIDLDLNRNQKSILVDILRNNSVKKVSLAAWADSEPFKIVFKDISVTNHPK